MTHTFPEDEGHPMAHHPEAAIARVPPCDMDHFLFLRSFYLAFFEGDILVFS
jgi:hypothetical protein